MDKHDNEPLLLRQVQDGIATITLNRPEARNALSMALMGEMLDAFRATGRRQVSEGGDPCRRRPRVLRRP